VVGVGVVAVGRASLLLMKGRNSSSSLKDLNVVVVVGEGVLLEKGYSSISSLMHMKVTVMMVVEEIGGLPQGKGCKSSSLRDLRVAMVLVVVRQGVL
jgi:hypothetical protein